jgi:hypothetical protein
MIKINMYRKNQIGPYKTVRKIVNQVKESNILSKVENFKKIKEHKIKCLLTIIRGEFYKM